MKSRVLVRDPLGSSSTRFRWLASVMSVRVNSMLASHSSFGSRDRLAAQPDGYSRFMNQIESNTSWLAKGL